jgi:hypothetical protein
MAAYGHSSPLPIASLSKVQEVRLHPPRQIRLPPPLPSAMGRRLSLAIPMNERLLFAAVAPKQPGSYRPLCTLAAIQTPGYRPR